MSVKKTRRNSLGSRYGPLSGCCECDNETSGFVKRAECSDARCRNTETQKCAHTIVQCPYFPLVDHPVPQAMFPPTPLHNDNLELLEMIRS